MPSPSPSHAPCEFHGDDAAACRQYGGDAPCSPGWTFDKPTQPGAYWFRGNGLEAEALIQVIEDQGELWCNLHMCTTKADFGFGYTIEQLGDDFEYLGPLFPAPSVSAQSPAPEGWRDVIERARNAIGAGSDGIHAEGERSTVEPYLDGIYEELEALEQQASAS